MMKKSILLSLFSLVTILAHSQTVLLSETFDSGIPATWQNIDNTTNGGGVWTWDNGGQFALFDSDAEGNDNTPEDADLISPSFDCTGQTFVSLSLAYGFLQFANSTGTISVSNDGGTTYTDLTVISQTGSNLLYFDISAIAAGESDVRLKFNYKGDWDYYWIIDDILVSNPLAKDIQGLAVTIGDYQDLANGGIDITGSLQNIGSEVITSFDLNYTINGGTVVTAPITNVNIGYGDVYNYTHPTPFVATTRGTYTAEVYATNLNGGVDGDMTNDRASKDFLVFDDFVQRVPLFEVFTSSTCGPCTPGNANFHSIVDTKPDHNYVSIKYQQDFPGTGDPYATSESISRRNFYAVNSIPRMEIDGGWDENANSFSEALYQNARANPSFTYLHATYTLDAASQGVNINVDGLPIINYDNGNYSLQVAVIENRTENNVKSNGETEFLQVMKKMLPNQNGTTLSSLDSITPFNFNEMYNFPGSYRLPSDGQTANVIDLATEHSVEDFTNLRVVVWVEEVATKTVLQAFNAVPNVDSDNDGVPDAVETYSGTNPNDPSDFPDVDNDGSSDWTEVVNGTRPDVAGVIAVDNDQDGFNDDIDCDDSNPDVNPGAVEIPGNGIDDDCDSLTLDVSGIDADNDGFDSLVDCDDNNAAVNPGATEITGNGIDDDCDPSTSDIVGIDEVVFANNLQLSPNPASSQIKVTFELAVADNIDMSIISMDGKVILTRSLLNTKDINETFNVSSLSNGIYFLKVSANNASSVRKFTVSK